MDIIEFREYCLSLPLATEEMPFDDEVLVFKIGGKIFAYTTISRFRWIGLKADPEEITDLRERYPEIGKPMNMNPAHWFSALTDGDLTDEFIRKLIRNSYDLVIKSMTRKQREELQQAIARL